MNRAEVRYTDREALPSPRDQKTAPRVFAHSNRKKMADEDLDIEAFRFKLLERRAELESVAEGSAEAAGTVELDQQRVGRVSRMDALQQQAMGVESERRRQLELRRIEAALQRIEDEDYGYCLTCGEQIAPARLGIDPAATQCIGCAEKAG